MSNSITLASKYRPHTFEDIVEQDSIKTILKNQIKSNDLKHAYLFCGSAGTGKTTSARIIADLMNEGKSTPIELDCASHNGVDDVRAIIDECKTKPMMGKYKIFILDECLTGDTEILTDQGFKRFDELDHTEKVAQYNDDGTIEFVFPERYINKRYIGKLECWQPRRGHTVKMTPNHIQPLMYSKSGVIKEKFIKDVKFAQSNNIIVSGKGIGNKQVLSYIDRLAIAVQADGNIHRRNKFDTRWEVKLSKQRKIDRLLMLLNNAGIEYNEVKSTRDNVRRFMFNLPTIITKKLSDYFKLEDISYACARSIIDEMKNWGGYVGTNYISYSSTIKDNTDFISAVASLGGYSGKQRVIKDYRSEKYNDLYSTTLYDIETRNCQRIQQTRTQEDFDGNVYCVVVPSHKIVVRAQGYTFVTGNCHQFSTSAWNALLKILEEPPEYVIFLFCTTDPQKILGTILSRVQRFNFSRISIAGITARLKYIIENENNERAVAGIDPIVYEDNAIDYIARLSQGGMRDSITTLEKCLDYSTTINLMNVINVTSGGVTEDVLLEMLSHILNNKCSEALLLFEKIYMSGVDVSMFLKLWTEYLQNCTKYVITQTAEITILSDITINRLDMALRPESGINIIASVKQLLDSVFHIKSNYSTDDMRILIESWIIEVCNS